MAVPLGDLASLQERFQKIFWGGVPFSEQSTVAFSVVVINGGPTSFITTVSNRGIHAEIGFIRQANLLEEIQDNIKITINLSKSPCFTCREDLEDFLESLTKRGATVSFTLRIANLYCGDGGGKDEIIEDLASWLYHLNREKIVDHLGIQNISVVTEMPDYSPRRVSIDEWEQIQGKRRDKDTIIYAIVDKIVATVDERAIAQTPVNIRPLFTTLTEVKETLKPAELKRTFIESSCATSNVYVAVAQVQINAVNTVGRSKEKVLKAFEKHGEGCCHTIPDIETEINTEINQFVKPESWSTQSSTIALAVTHFPCNDCLVRITNEITLILRVANVPYEKVTVDRLFERYQAGITIQLHAIRVMVELGQVNCILVLQAEQRQWTIEKQQQWRIAKQREWSSAKQNRQQSDVAAVENVRLINNELSERIIEERVIEEECERLRCICIS